MYNRCALLSIKVSISIATKYSNKNNISNEFVTHISNYQIVLLTPN